MWDPLVRIVHWTVAALVVTDLLNEAGANPWHRNLGDAAGALVGLRLVWGLVGPRPARLSSMVRAARKALPYARSLARPAGELPAGHNPLGASMAFVLWSLVLGVVVTGWMLRLDAFWGDDAVERVHSTAAYVLGAMALVHVAGAIATSLRYRVNLVAAMVTGRRRAP
jgi:cytochrome b